MHGRRDLEKVTKNTIPLCQPVLTTKQSKMARLAVGTALLLWTVVACVPPAATTQSDGPPESASGYTCTPNADSTLLLCVRERSSSAVQGIRESEFRVVNSKSGQVVYEDNLRSGSVAWHDSQTILVTKGLGYMNDPHNATEKYLIDLGSKQRRAVPENNNQK